ncbi:unnamed protein product [Boreogadus saida]
MGATHNQRGSSLGKGADRHQKAQGVPGGNTTGIQDQTFEMVVAELTISPSEPVAHDSPKCAVLALYHNAMRRSERVKRMTFLVSSTCTSMGIMEHPGSAGVMGLIAEGVLHLTPS